ncbi:hypothetical protein [Vineibacter terrae]|uniref:hypothetical protein n=1 Tax=Vineibacter terrae TaxID=2586908 RepID=UPI002E331109|nr:hypothetical protein [Vineibacter terrae]HEX2892343.1 hypothetical protein [Vineibacter terrae]
MRMTIEISDALLHEMRKLAADEGVTLSALVERGLRQVVTEASRHAPFKLRRASFKGKGLQADLGQVSWDQVCCLAYEGRSA